MIQPIAQERKTKPRIVSGTAVQQTIAILNGTPRRGKLVVTHDGRIYFNMNHRKLTDTNTLNSDGQRLLTAEGSEVWVQDTVFQKLKDMAAALVMGVSR